MQESVNEQALDLTAERRIVVGRLAARGVDADHDIAQQPLRTGVRIAVLDERKAQDVGRCVLAAVRAVERANRRIAHERNRHRRAGFTERSQKRIGGCLEGGKIEPAAAGRIGKIDRHGSGVRAGAGELAIMRLDPVDERFEMLRDAGAHRGQVVLDMRRHDGQTDAPHEGVAFELA